MSTSADVASAPLVTDPDRLQALRAYDILDTPPDESFDRITQLAADVFDVPYAYVNFVDAHRQWSKSCVGEELEEVPLDESFCAHAIRSSDPMVVEDATEDPRFEDNAFVESDHGVRFYAGTPLTTSEGERIGTLCVLDTEARSLSDSEVDRLEDMGEVVVDLLEMQRALDERRRIQRKLKRIETAVAHSTDAVVITDEDRIPVYQNPAFADLFGYTTEALRERGSMATLMENSGRAETLWTTLEEGRSWSGTVEMTTAADELCTIELRASAVVDDEGEVIGYMHVLADVTETERMEQLQRGQRRILRQIAEGDSLSSVLRALTGLIEAQRPDLIASILLLDDGRLRHGAGPNLPHAFAQAIDGVEIGERVGACGTAAHRNELVVTEDVASDPHWENYREIALAHDLRACWSTPIRDEDGDVLGTFAFYTDTPRRPDDAEIDLARVAERIASIAIERTRREEDLRESEARYRLLAENVRDVVCLHAPDATYRWVSPSAEEILDLKPGDVVGTHPLDWIHPDDHEHVREFHRTLREEGTAEAITYRFRHADGHYVWLETLPRVIYGDDGEVAQIQTSSRDVSEQVRYQEDLLEAKREAEKMNRLKSAFLANMSHEIRTPLTSIIGFAEILQEEASESHQRMSQLIHRAGTRLMETLDSVLQLSRLEAGMMQLDRQEVDVVREVEETVDLLRPRAAENGVAVSVSSEADDDTMTGHWDPGAFHRILTNVLGNAIKFTGDGGHVDVRLRRQNGSVEIEVEDDGVGIAPDFQSELFDAFKQEQSGTRRAYEGSGLGLTVVKRLVEAHDGTVEVESEKGTGSRFRIQLPA